MTQEAANSSQKARKKVFAALSLNTPRALGHDVYGSSALLSIMAFTTRCLI